MKESDTLILAVHTWLVYEATEMNSVKRLEICVGRSNSDCFEMKLRIYQKPTLWQLLCFTMAMKKTRHKQQLVWKKTYHKQQLVIHTWIPLLTQAMAPRTCLIHQNLLQNHEQAVVYNLRGSFGHNPEYSISSIR